MKESVRRERITKACMDRFNGKPLIAGRRDCATLAAHAMHKAGRKADILTGSSHTTWAGAVKYIRKQGCKSLVELMDASGLERIPPASAWPGDIVALPSSDGDGFGCSLTVALDNGRVLGFNSETGNCEPHQPFMFVAAWRV
jgi:hypothetical protein